MILSEWRGGSDGGVVEGVMRGNVKGEESKVREV